MKAENKIKEKLKELEKELELNLSYEGNSLSHDIINNDIKCLEYNIRIIKWVLED